MRTSWTALRNARCANPASWSIPDLWYKLPPDKQKPLPFLVLQSQI